MTPVVELREVRLRLGGTATQAVDFRVDAFQLNAGEQMAVTGPSGCGKSTLLNLIAGLQRPDQGSLQVLGHNLRTLATTQLDRLRGSAMGLVHQEFLLLDRFTALENVRLGLRFGRAPRHGQRALAQQWLNRVGLTHREHARPSQLSMGERQRVALARAMAHQPRLVLADEPTGSLDPDTASEVFGLLRSVCAQANCALLVVTHDLAMAAQLPRRFEAGGLITGTGGSR
jgi:putative ABC transport system ATP-binding protein